MKPTTVLAVALLVSSSSVAQTPSSSSSELPAEVRYRTSSAVDFTPVSIEGAVKGPPGFRIHQRKKVSFKAMIELRSDFRDALSTTPAAL